MKMKSKKLISLILAVVLVLGIFPMAGFATGEEDPVNDPPAITQAPGDPSDDGTGAPAGDDGTGTPAGDDGTGTPPGDDGTGTPPGDDDTGTPEPAAVVLADLSSDDLYAYLLTLNGDELTDALGELTQDQIDSIDGIMTTEQASEWFGIETPEAVVLADLSGNELYAYLLTLNADELTDALGELTQGQIDSLDGIMTTEQASEWFGIEAFVPLALGAGFMPFVAMATAELDNEDLVTTKDATYNSGSDTVSIQLTAYAKGILHQVGKPADIVLVLDQSTSMGGAFGTETRFTPVFAQMSGSNNRWINYDGASTRLTYTTVNGIAEFYRGSSPNSVRVFSAFQNQTNLPAETYQFYDDSRIRNQDRVYPTLNTGTTYYIFQDGEYRQLTYSSGWYYNSTRYFPILDGQNQTATSVQFYTRSTVSLTRADALIDAVTSFVSAVRAQTTAEMDFKISLVGFNNSASYLTGSSASDTLLAATDTAIDTAIDGLDNLANYTRQDLGLNLANNVFNTTIPEDRNRIVILFTDGEPYSGTSGVTNNDIIEDALTNAREMKNDKGTSVFTIGIGDTSLDPSDPPVEGETDQNTFLHCVSSNYPVATMATLTTYTRFTNYNPSTSNSYYIFRNYDGAAPSTPSGEATQVQYRTSGTDGWYYWSGSSWARVYYVRSGDQVMSDSEYHFWTTSSSGGIVPGVRNPSVDAEGHLMQFYHTADDAEELSDVFLAVQESLSGGMENITVKDYLMPQFEMGPSAITSISARIGSTPVDSNLIHYDPATRLLSVGPVQLPAVIMDGGVPAAGELAAKQLVITFTADVKEDFIGGNDVLTNDVGSGVYGSEGNPIENFERPEVNVPLEYDLFSLADQNVYLGDGALISDFFVTDTYSIEDNPYEYDGDNNGYVNIIYTVKDENGTTIGTYTVEAAELNGDFAPGFSNTLTNLTEDTWYTITASIAPSETGDPANGAVAVPITSEDGDEIANIYVYKPVVTTLDLAVYLTKNPTDAELTANAIDTVSWMHGTTNANDVPMTQSTEPDLDYTFDLPTTGYPTADTTVNITGIATVRGSTTTATLTGAGLSGRVSPFTVYVLKPIIDCADSTMFVGDATISWNALGGTGYLQGFLPASWSSLPVGVTAAILDSAPTNVTLAIDESALTADATGTGFTPATLGDHDLKIKVEIGGNDVTAYSTINNPVAGQTGHHFTITVIGGTLTINKSVTGAKDDECFIFTVTVTPAFGSQYFFKEVIEGNGSKVIKGLPKGTYSVSEDTAWSWHYNTVAGPVWSAGVNAISLANTSIACTITNSSRTPFWLSDDTLAVNRFAPYNPVA